MCVLGGGLKQCLWIGHSRSKETYWRMMVPPSPPLVHCPAHLKCYILSDYRRKPCKRSVTVRWFPKMIRYRYLNNYQCFFIHILVHKLIMKIILYPWEKSCIGLHIIKYLKAFNMKIFLNIHVNYSRIQIKYKIYLIWNKSLF